MNVTESSAITGLVAAVHTPFDRHGNLDLAAIEQQAGHLISQGIRYAFICGSTGESHSLTLNERRQMAERWTAVAHGSSLQVIVHVGANCLRDSAELASHAEGHQVRAVAALSPSYFKPNSVMELIDAMAAIAEAASQTPFYFYDIPSMTQVRLSMPEFLEHALARIPNLAGLKFTNEDFTSLQRCLHSHDRSWNILWGVDEALLGALSFGVTGAVGSSYNFAAPIFHRVIAAFTLGDWETARREQFRAVEIIQLLARFGYLPAAKQVMDWLGVPVGGTRLPLTDLSAEQSGDLKLALEQMGFFDPL